MARSCWKLNTTPGSTFIRIRQEHPLAKDHTTLVATVKVAVLVDTLEGPGPLTIFAPPTKRSISCRPWTVNMLLKPEYVDQLKKIFTYHVVAGRLAANRDDAGGKLVVTDEKSDTVTITNAI